MRPSFADSIRKICAADPRYEFDAYLFVREALDVTSKMLNKPSEGPERHVSGRELMDGMRMYALQEFGPVALRVLRSWGICSTEDFGQIVFNMVDHGVLGRTDKDTREDFAGGYDFHDAFVVPFLPRSAKKPEETVPRRRAAGRSKAAGKDEQPGDKT